MSKISLEPNDSGAGTFSIVSPDSNINRTLNLPDEAGKLLSTGNDDPAEVFKQSNILGTVSESDGVPTGAIIERGSNSNGEFVKYADGTMICTQVRTDSVSITRSRGSIFTLDGDIRQNYPAAFVPDRTNVTSARVYGGEISTRRLWSIDPGTSTPAHNNDWRWSVASAESTDGTLNVQLLAIGRWY